MDVPKVRGSAPVKVEGSARTAPVDPDQDTVFFEGTSKLATFERALLARDKEGQQAMPLNVVIDRYYQNTAKSFGLGYHLAHMMGQYHELWQAKQRKSSHGKREPYCGSLEQGSPCRESESRGERSSVGGGDGKSRAGDGKG
ncbi:hypothetical protein U1Q18_013706 [Sarracenia purpurea var. burkii]